MLQDAGSQCKPAHLEMMMGTIVHRSPSKGPQPLLLLLLQLLLLFLLP